MRGAPRRIARRLSAEQLAEIKCLAESGFGPREIISRMGLIVSKHTIRYHTDETYRAKYIGNQSKYVSQMKREPASARDKLRVLQEPLEYASLTAKLMGDPPIGRSALDRRAKMEDRKNEQEECVGEVQVAGEASVGEAHV